MVSLPYQTTPISIDIVILGLLLLLLVQKELLRAYDNVRFERWIQVLNVVIVPLVLGAGVMMLARLLLFLS